MRMGFISDDRSPPKITAKIPTDFKHCKIIGETGSGKTSGFILPNLDERIKAGHGILLFDFKGNLHTSVKSLALQHGRLDQVVHIGTHIGGKRINLLEKMTDPEIERMLISTFGHSKENKFWEQSSVKLALPILDALKQYEELQKQWSFIADFYPDTFASPYIYIPLWIIRQKFSHTIASLYRNASSRQALESFEGGLTKTLSVMEDHFFEIQADLTVAQAKDEYLKELLDDYGQALYEFRNIVIDATKEIRDLNDIESKSNIPDSTILSLANPLARIAHSEFVNESEVYLPDQLNAGSIVILNSVTLPSSVLSPLLQSVFQELIARVYDKGKKVPITIFVDEAQRVIDQYLDLPIDILREAKVDLIVASQSDHALAHAMGETKFMNMNANLTKKFVMRSHDHPELEPFEYQTNSDGYKGVHKAKPLFIPEEDLFEAEWKFQTMLGVFDDIELIGDFMENIDEAYILVYVPRLWDRGQAKLQTISGKEYQVRFRNRGDQAKVREYFELQLRRIKIKRQREARDQKIRNSKEINPMKYESVVKAIGSFIVMHFREYTLLSLDPQTKQSQAFVIQLQKALDKAFHDKLIDTRMVVDSELMAILDVYANKLFLENGGGSGGDDAPLIE